MILALGFDLLGNYDDAKDLAQEVFIRAFEKLNMFQERSRFSTWLYRIAVNHATDLHRARQKNPHQPLEDTVDSDISETIHSTTPEDQIETDELNLHVKKALEKLALNQRTAVALRYFHQKSSAEIAEIMGCNVNTVRIHIHRAMGKLKRHLRAFKTK